jgi:hypothetical protein
MAVHFSLYVLPVVVSTVVMHAEVRMVALLLNFETKNFAFFEMLFQNPQQAKKCAGPFLSFLHFLTTNDD